MHHLFLNWKKIIEPPHDKTNKMTVRPAKTQVSLGIRSVWSVFAVRMKKAWVLSYPLSAQRRLWSAWADAHADLSLHWGAQSFWGGSYVSHSLEVSLHILLQHLESKGKMGRKSKYLVSSTHLSIFSDIGVGIPWGLDKQKITPHGNSTEYFDTGPLNTLNWIREEMNKFYGTSKGFLTHICDSLVGK